MGDSEIERLAVLETKVEALETSLANIAKSVEGLTAAVNALLVKASILFAAIAFVANKLAENIHF